MLTKNFTKKFLTVFEKRQPIMASNFSVVVITRLSGYPDYTMFLSFNGNGRRI